MPTVTNWILNSHNSEWTVCSMLHTFFSCCLEWLQHFPGCHGTRIECYPLWIERHQFPSQQGLAAVGCLLRVRTINLINTMNTILQSETLDEDIPTLLTSPWQLCYDALAPPWSGSQILVRRRLSARMMLGGVVILDKSRWRSQPSSPLYRWLRNLCRFLFFAESPIKIIGESAK